jgi:hypothetical protein
MAVTTIQTNNKLIQYTKDINREYVRENLFSPYMGEAANSIIRIRNETKKGGEQINIPLVARLAAAGFSTGTLAGQEEAIDDYGYRCWVDYARNAVRTNKYQSQIDSADIFGEAKPHLSDWGKELQKLEIIKAMMALPAEAAPAGLASSAGQRVNGILFESATAGNKNTFAADNADRLLFGATTANYSATFATGLDTVDATADKFNGAAVTLLKFMAKHANPRIRPYMLESGREYFVIFAGGLPFRDLKADLKSVNADARERNVDTNPIFQDGDLMYDGCIIREIPEIDDMVRAGGIWNAALTNTGTVLCHPVFLCGQSALAMPWGQMARPTFLKEDDYQFNTGAGVEMCYGVGKVFKKHPKAGTALKQWGMVTGFFAASAT